MNSRFFFAFLSEYSGLSASLSQSRLTPLLRSSPSRMQWRHLMLMQPTVFLRCWYFRWSLISKSNNGVSPQGLEYVFALRRWQCHLTLLQQRIKQTATGTWALGLWRHNYAKLSPSKRYQTSLVLAVPCLLPPLHLLLLLLPFLLLQILFKVGLLQFDSHHFTPLIVPWRAFWFAADNNRTSHSCLLSPLVPQWENHFAQELDKELGGLTSEPGGKQAKQTKRR